MIARGVVLGARGALVEARIPRAAIGDGVRIDGGRGSVSGVVTALGNGSCIIAPHDGIDGISAGDAACVDPNALRLPLGVSLLGRAIDARGNALDGGAPPRGMKHRVLLRAPAPERRTALRTPFWSGIRTLDGLLTFARGARIGIFGPPGAGKSTILRMLVNGSRADAVVLALIGERGREAEEWMRHRPAHSSIVCATSDRSAAQRVHAARVAMAQARNLQSRGLHVLLILDSLARFGAALREISVACGEACGRGGFPPSVFADLAAYVEMAGAFEAGSITMVATVLSDGDERDPLSEAARSLLDGHIQLSAELAQAGRFPAIDVPASTSRTMAQVIDEEHAADARTVRRALVALRDTREARSLGLMPAEPAALRAIAAEAAVEAFLRQGDTPAQPSRTLADLRVLADTLR